MDLYFVRHGAAASRASWDESDEARPLTKTGQTKFREAAEALAAAGALRIDLVLSSPLVRAKQTAKLLADACDPAPPMKIDDRLDPLFDLERLGGILADNSDVASVAIVGHNPSFTEVLSQVTGGGNLDVRKGAIALVNFRDASTSVGTLMWLAPTQLFRPCS